MIFLASLAEVEWQSTLFAVFGGLGIFLFGINLMGDSLKAIAGNRLKVIIEKTTNTPLKGIIVGILITGLIQSSSGTTAITVGLVRAGLMTLPQAVGIILGANIGTTVTSILIGLKIKAYALPIMAIGSGLVFFVKKRKVNQLGTALLGFGMLFYGLDLMGGALKEFSKLPEFKNALASVGEFPILGLGVGAISTAVIQSSSATIGILQELYTTGTIPLIGAVAIVLGDNIGTTVTAILASIGGTIAAKRAALAHVLFNLFGSILFFILLVPYTALIGQLQDIFFNGSHDKLTISFAHIGFNLINTFIFFWFIKQLVWAVKKLIPGTDSIQDLARVDSLDENLIEQSPVMALESAKSVIVIMGNVCVDMFNHTVKYSFENDRKQLESGTQLEEVIDAIDRKVHDYLVRLASKDLSASSSNQHVAYVDSIRDFERIADHCQNILEFFEYRYENKFTLTKEAKSDLENLYGEVSRILSSSIEALENNDTDVARTVVEIEDNIDRLCRKYRKRHIKRINDKLHFETEDGFYVDILSNVERIGDHCHNIVQNIINDSYYNDEFDIDM